MHHDTARKEMTRTRVIKAAATAIRRDGPYRLGVAGVMAKAGLTHGGFYFHFASKDELIVAAMAQMFEEGRALFTRVTEHKTPRDALRAYVEYYLSPMHRDLRDAGCALPVLSIDAPRLGPKARAFYSAAVSRLCAAITDLMAQAGVANAQSMATSVIAELVGALTLARAIADRSESDAVLARSRDTILARLGLARRAVARRAKPVS